METLYRICAGLDVHKTTVVACVRRLDTTGKVRQQTRTFATTTAALLELCDWLSNAGVTHVAMESTGVYWKPIWNILEGQFQMLLVNAQHIKQVPGRKTDVKDAEWIAQLLQHGLLRGSCVPPRPQRELRELTRQRRKLVDANAAVANRIQKILEDANIKLGSVATDVLGVSGRAMLESIIAGQEDPVTMAQQARGRMRRKIGELEQALRGRVTEHHRFLLRLLLDDWDNRVRLITRLTERIEAVLTTPTREAVVRLATIPGIDRRAAEAIIAETGPDAAAFDSAARMASWAGVCPGNDESAGKRRSGKTTKGNRWLRVFLVQAAWAASHTKQTYLSAQYRRLASRRGRKRALVGLAHTLLVVIYHVVKKQTTYHDLGGDYLLRSVELAANHSWLGPTLGEPGPQSESPASVADLRSLVGRDGTTMPFNEGRGLLSPGAGLIFRAEQSVRHERGSPHFGLGLPRRGSSRICPCASNCFCSFAYGKS